MGHNAQGHIFCIIGKSSTGKDCFFKQLLKDQPVPLSTLITYTTRPIRDHETEGVEYHFRTADEFKKMQAEGRVIEFRCYHTVYGDWYYFTADDGQITDDGRNFLLSSTLEGYNNLVAFYGSERVVPLYVEVEDGERLIRAIARERTQAVPKYVEMCRRFIADSADFAEDKILESGITRRYINDDFDRCLAEMEDELIRYRGE